MGNRPPQGNTPTDENRHSQEVKKKKSKKHWWNRKPTQNNQSNGVTPVDGVIGETTPLPAPPAPPPPPRHSMKEMVRALYAYDGQNPDDLKFAKGDVLFVLDKSELWWRAEHSRTHEKGYIPSNYVVIDDGLPTSLDAWYPVVRREADKHLLMMGNPSGTYVIRPSTDPRHYALSVRYHERDNLWVVKHYKIKTLDDNQGYYISTKMTFPAIRDLIEHYSEESDGLCCRLKEACPRQYKPPVQFREMEVNRDSINQLRKLGNGSFGEVWLSKWNNAIEVAVKSLRPNTMDRSAFIGEAEVMHKLHHPRIVQIMGICTEPADEPVLIITELLSKGALLDFLRSEEGHKINIVELIDMMGQISEGMAYLENMMFVHRDLRAANILVGDDNSVKVADFGLAGVTHGEVFTAEEGTKFPIKWTAPEAALSRTFSTKSDIWSFGILMYEMVTYGRSPYPGMTNRQVMEEVAKGYRMPNPNDLNTPFSEEIYEIMLSTWDIQPNQRPTFDYMQSQFDNLSVATEGQYLQQDV